MKFGRRYKITIETKNGTALVIEPPLTIRFDIQRKLLASMNGMVLQIYNLSPASRNLIYQDRFDLSRFQIIVEMGYDKLSTVFRGDIFEANSSRQGNDIITTIDARDGYFDLNDTVISNTFKGGAPLREVLDFLMRQFPNLKKGALGNAYGEFDKELSRPVVLEGNVFDLIQNYTLSVNAIPFIDLEVINILGIDELVVNNAITVLNASTGLIHTPRRDQSYLTVNTLLEPRVVVGQIVNIESEILPQYNGIYKVIGIQHQGIISEAVGGRCESTFNLNGNQIAGGFKVVS